MYVPPASHFTCIQMFGLHWLASADRIPDSADLCCFIFHKIILKSPDSYSIYQLVNLICGQYPFQSLFYSWNRNVHLSWASQSLFYFCLIEFRLFIFSVSVSVYVSDFTLIYLLLKCPLHCPLLYQEGVIVTNTLFSRRKGESLVAPPFFGILPTFQFR